MKVYGLVGPSGSGKSHHAPMIARKLGVRDIVDDGVLIRDGKLVAGYSAKFEKNKISAIRRALFSSPGQAADVVRALRGSEAVLVLGTSRRMIEAIARNLNLPAGIQWLDIESVLSPEQIVLAQSLRKYGMHAVPVEQHHEDGSHLLRLLRRLRYRLTDGPSLAPDLPHMTVVTAAFGDGTIHVHPRVIQQSLSHLLRQKQYPLRMTRSSVSHDAFPTIQVSVRAEFRKDLLSYVHQFLRDAWYLLREILGVPYIRIQITVESIVLPRR